ncbi:sensor histidine kinase [Aquabacter sp. CN5-332]|uniref:sensor histidine kinase n=1 Tax=Aquabacter sp. CN5-332 TaxID=3156608 RepID=UPI0032B49715
MRGAACAFLFVLASLYVLATASACAAAPLIITGASDHQSADGHMEVLRDEDGSLSIDDLASGRMDARFSPLAGGFNGGFIRSGAYWIRFSIVPAAPLAYGQWWLALVAPLVDRLDVYLPAPDGAPGYIHEEGGALTVVQAQRARMQAYLFPLDFSEPREQTIYVRLAGARSISLSPEIWRTAPLYDYLLRLSLLYSLICGFLLFTAVAGFTFGVTLRERSLIVYGFYMLVTSVLFLINDGYLSLLKPSISPEFARRIIGVAAFGSVTLATCVVVEVFSTWKRFPRLHLVCVVTIGLGICAIIASVAGFYGNIAPALSGFVLLLTFLTPVVAFRFMRANEPAGTIFFVGFSVYSLTMLIAQGRFLGLLPVTPFTEWGYQAVACVHATSILLGLATRMRTAEQAKLRLQDELLVRMHSEGVALEAAVRQRTRALEEEVGSRRAAEQALQTMLREQRHLLAMVSHEFRSPLGIIRASISMIGLYARGIAAPIHAELEKMARAVERLVSFIDACLADERLDDASLQVKRIRTNISELIEQRAAERAVTRSRTVRTDIEPGIHADIDPTLVGIIVDNLIGNALKYSEDDLPVDVVVRADEAAHSILITVEDRGLGIIEDEQALIFDRYFRGQQSLARPGLGLGLHVAQRIAILHGGRIEVASVLGKGSLFTLTLPAQETASA